jgi:hypothetical protein
MRLLLALLFCLRIATMHCIAGRREYVTTEPFHDAPIQDDDCHCQPDCEKKSPNLLPSTKLDARDAGLFWIISLEIRCQVTCSMVRNVLNFSFSSPPHLFAATMPLLGIFCSMGMLHKE